MAAVGDRLWVVGCGGGEGASRRLQDLGLVRGCELAIVSRTGGGSAVVALDGCRIGLGAGLAHKVIVTAMQPVAPPSAATSEALSNGDDTMVETQALGTFTPGQRGRIVGYAPGNRHYRDKLLSMGLTPGTPFTLTRRAPMGDPVEVTVRGYKLSLRKDEAAALHVELAVPEEVSHD